MNLDFNKALNAPFRFRDKAESVWIYIIATVLAFLGFFNFSFNCNGSSSSSGMGSSDFSMDSIRNQIGDFASSEFFWILLMISTILFIVLFMVRIFCISAINGYILETMRRESSDTEFIMPQWANNFKSFLLDGFKFTIAMAIYWIICFIPALIFIGVTVFLCIKADCASNFLLYTPGIIGIIIILISCIVILILQPGIMYNYSIENKFSECFNISSLYETISKKFGDYLIIVLIQIPVAILLVFVNIIMCCTCIGLLFIPLVNSFIYSIIIMNLFSQAFKR